MKILPSEKAEDESETDGVEHDKPRTILLEGKAVVVAIEHPFQGPKRDNRVRRASAPAAPF